MSMGLDEVEIFATLKKKTLKAMLIDDGDRECWLPLSQIDFNEDEAEEGDGIIKIPEWLAFEKELI